ncbi:MAG TPA: VWA domain-containing protein [Thermoanaerobaculia bacterium]|nr:VWA domain-containing protein [Thermoanaerobaculia bacterium]
MKPAWCIAVFAAAVAFAQQPYIETFELRLHNLDAVVTDAKGEPVRGLTKDDFIVLENGAPQNITNFSVYDTTPSETTGSQPVDDEEPEPESPRRFIFFVDDMSLRKPIRESLIRDANTLIEQLEENDLIAVVRPIGAKRMPQPFTTNRAAAREVLTEAIESCKLRLTGSHASRSRMDNAREEGEARYARREYIQSERERVEQRLSQLRALIASMAGVEGRKVLVLLTEGIPSIPGRDVMDPFGRIGAERPVDDWGQTGEDLNPLIDELGRTAAANGVTIYALEPELSFNAAIPRIQTGAEKLRARGSDAQARSQPIVEREAHGERMHYQAQTLRSLSERTGGRWSRGAATIDDVFRQVATDLSVYYSMAYRATGEENKPRRVTVQVRDRPELTVRTRTEVIERSAAREMGDLVASTLLFPRNVNELRISLETGKPKRKGSTVTIPIDVVIPLETMTFIRADNGKYAAALDIHHSVAGLERPFATTGRHRQDVVISADEYKKRKTINYRFKTGIEVWRGPTRIAIGVMDPVSHLVGFRTADVNAQ